MLYAIMDVETPGLDADRGDLLEVACILYDPDEDGIYDRFEHVIYYPAARMELIRDNAAPFVRDMHHDNGLWSELPLGRPLVDVDDDLAYFLSSAKADAGQTDLHLVGNSCRLDLNFIERHLPLTYAQLHYRSIDLSGIWLASKAAHNEFVFKKDEIAHRAMDDCEQALEQFKMTLGRMADL